MALTAFTSRLGRGQGRLATSKATGGDYTFVLGDAEPGRLFELAPGDHAEVTQQTDLAGVMLVRALLRLRVPASTPPGFNEVSRQGRVGRVDAPQAPLWVRDHRVTQGVRCGGLGCGCPGISV